MLVIFVFVIILLFCLVLLMLPYNKHIDKKYAKGLFIASAVLLATIGALIEPKEIYDLFRHYEVIERIRESSYSLKDFLTNSSNIIDSNYKYTYVYNIIVYFIAKYLPNQTLPFVTILITYSVFGEILFSELNKKKILVKNIVVSFAAFSIFLPYLYTYSNIRTPLASAIIAYGIYRLYNSKKVFVFFMCTIISTFIHPAVFSIIPFVAISIIRPSTKKIWIVILFPYFIFMVMEYFRLQLGNDFLFRIAAKYYNYTLVREDDQGKTFLYSTVIMLVIVISSLLFLLNNDKKKIETSKCYLLNLIIWYSAFSLGYIKNYHMILRLPFTIAFLSPIIFNSIYIKDRKISKISNLLLLVIEMGVIAIWFMGIYQNIMWLI